MFLLLLRVSEVAARDGASSLGAGVKKAHARSVDMEPASSVSHHPRGVCYSCMERVGKGDIVPDCP